MFVSTVSGVVVLWSGSPSDQAAHDWVLEWFKELDVEFAAIPVTLRVKGNMGESICFAIGRHSSFAGLLKDAANALTPFSDVSRPDVDIVWTQIGETVGEDAVFLQEVKTTSSADLAYADALTDDYGKLFGTNPELTLQTRLQAIGTKLHYLQRHPRDSIARLAALAGVSPQTTERVTLIPSLVCDNTAPRDAAVKMAAVRQAIIAQGWNPLNVVPWAVGIGNLDPRFQRLRAGQR